MNKTIEIKLVLECTYEKGRQSNVIHIGMPGAKVDVDGVFAGEIVPLIGGGGLDIQDKRSGNHWHLSAERLWRAYEDALELQTA